MKNLKYYLKDYLSEEAAVPADTMGMGEPQDHELVRPDGIPHETIKIKHKKKLKKMRFKRDFL